MRCWIAIVVGGMVGCSQILGFEQIGVIELGALCTGPGGGEADLCQPEAPICVSLGGGTFQCTASCGSAPAAPDPDSPVPPAGGDAICSSLISVGTPVCGVFGEAMNGQVPWFCVILCGTLGDDDLGSCPPGLTCTSNSCQ